MEIERKFLVNEIPGDLNRFEYHELSQGYISTFPVIRIRQWDDEYILTVKSGGLLAREEYEINLSREEFENLQGKVSGNIIKKTRYIIPIEDTGLKVELDIFHGAFEGLVYAEVEFPDIETAEAFTPLPYFGREVTMEGGYSNAALSEAEDPAIYLKK